MITDVAEKDMTKNHQEELFYMNWEIKLIV